MFLPRGRARKRVLCALAIGGTLIMAAPQLSTQAELAPLDIYTIGGIAVDERAETGSRARDLALAEGQRRAWQRLMRRLVLAVDLPRLPELRDHDIAALVQGIEIQNERVSSVRYLSELTIHFRKSEVRAWLQKAGVPFTETRRKPVLVVPVYEAAGALLLWDDPNPWTDTWRVHADDPDDVVPLVVPEGDFADVVAINAQQAIDGENERLAALAERYGVADTVVAYAALRIDLAADTKRLVVSTKRYGAPGEERAVIESFEGESREVVESLLADAVAAIAGRLQEEWKRETLVRFDQPVQLSVTVPLTSLEEWVEVRRLLRTSSLVREIELVSLSRRAAQVVLHFLGDADQLAVELTQRELDLSREEGGFWALRTAVE